MARTDVNPRHTHDYKAVNKVINIKFQESIPGNSSIKYLPDREILARIERTKDPVQRGKESPIGIPASIISEAHEGLINELNSRKV